MFRTCLTWSVRYRSSILPTIQRSRAAASLASVTTGDSRCGMPSYTESSSRLGSTMRKRTSAGVALYRIEQIIGEVHHLRDLHAGRRLELVGGDDRAGAHLHDAAVDLEVGELAPEDLGVVLQLLARALELGGRRRLEQADRRQLERLGAMLAEVERLLPRQALLHERALGARRLHDRGQRQLRRLHRGLGDD